MPPILLHAGLLQLVLFPDDGTVRYLFAGEHEVLRGIGAPVRDQAWATVRPEISQLKVDQQKDSFHVSFDVRCQAHAVDFRWHGELTGAKDGTLVFDFDGEALSDFQRNRIGFCVLHAAEAGGTSCVVEHTDGKIENGRFPEFIKTGAPFSTIRAITHPIAPGLEAEVRLEGDTFEMEDQRNWTDASFKTYCTPLGLPRPVFIAKGTRIHQRVTVRLHGTPSPARTGFTPPWRTPEEVQVTVGALLDKKLPALGTVWNLTQSDDAVVAALRPLNLAHLRVELWLNSPSHPDVLRAGADAAEKLGAALELAVLVDDHATEQLTKLRATLSVLSPAPRIARWIILHEGRDCTPPASVTAAREIFDEPSFAAPIGGGTTDNFTELNYNPDSAPAPDFTVHACNPQVHAFDEASIVETLAMQRLTAINARRLSGGHPVAISPVTFTRRWRLSDSGAPVGLPAALMPFQNDPRQSSPFMAAWTAGSLAALATEGLASLTYFEASGANGLQSPDGAPFPVFKVFAELAPFTDAAVATTESSHPLSVAALALIGHGRRVVLLANLRETRQAVHISGTWGDQTVQLPAYGVQLCFFDERQ